MGYSEGGRGGPDFARWKGMIHLPIFMSALAEGVAAERLKYLRELNNEELAVCRNRLNALLGKIDTYACTVQKKE